MSTYTTSLRRVVIFISGVAVGLLLLSGAASAAPAERSSGNDAHTSANPDNQQAQPASTADQSGHGANTSGSYDSTRDGSASGNGSSGGGQGTACAGCTGKADNKYPKGQMSDGYDHNNGYECDGNKGVARTNPAHTGCPSPSASTSVVTTQGSTTTGGTTSSAPATAPAAPSSPADPPVGPTVPTADKPACDRAVASNGCPPATEVAGAHLERAAQATGTAGAAHVTGGSTRGTGGVEVLGATLTRGSSLPVTGANSLVLVAVALAFLAAGFTLVGRARRARS